MEITNVKKNIQKITIIKKRDVMHLLISFMMGRIFLMDAISPFAISYLCSYMHTKKRSTVKIVITVAAALAGTFSCKYSHTLARYLLAYVLFGLIYISVSTIWNKTNEHIPAISSLFAMSISGIIYYAQLDNLLHNLLMLAFECAICVVFPYIIKPTADIVCNRDIFSDIKPKDIAGMCVLTVVAMTGFCGMTIGNISVGKAMCGAIVMVIAYTGGCTMAVTCGVGLGILFSLYSFEYSEYVGILGFCGLVSGVTSKFKRAGIVLSFIISTRLLAMYFGGWSEAIFSEFETIIAVCTFCLIPNSLLMRIRAYFSTGLIHNDEFKKHTDMINSKISFATKSFETLIDISRKVIGKIPENTKDLSTIYDITADKVCKSCGLKFVCWDKEAFDTRDALNKTVIVLDSIGHLENENVPVEFKKKCIKYESFVKELNRTYFRYKANFEWQDKMKHSQNMISAQLNGMSHIIDEISKNINEDITFDKVEESKIMHSLEQADIRCTDVTVVKDHINIPSVTLVIKPKKADFTNICQTIELLVSASLEKNMKIESYGCNNNKFTVKLKETERFSVDCSYISIPKNGETLCGDSILHSKISGGKYALILSDGMGCGINAQNQSSTATELMQQFLNAGFDKRNAVEMINSTLMLKNSETFATLDAVVIDMFTAKADFIKAGANTTYVKTGKRIKKISSNSLPIGIINNTKADTMEYQAKDGDIIILISDGIHNATDNWFEDYILNMHEDSPRMIAKLLADEAERRKTQEDDMTVAVLRIFKNEEGLYV